MLGEILIQFYDLGTRRGVERRQSEVLRVVDRRYMGFVAPGQYALQAPCPTAEIKSEHRKPGKDLHMRPRPQLPCRTVEQIGAHRQETVWKVHFARQAIAGLIGERLQEHRVDAKVADVLHERAQ